MSASVTTNAPPTSMVPPGAMGNAGGPHVVRAALGSPLGARRADERLEHAARREALASIGWRHSVLSLGQGGAAGRHPLAWLSAARWWLDRSSVTRALTDARPHIIETAEPFRLGGAVLDAADRLGVPAVALCHGDWLLGLRRGLARAHGCYDGFDLVLAPSLAMTAQLQAMGVTHAAYQPIGIDCGTFTPNAGDHAWRRGLETRLNLTPGTRLVLYVGRLGGRMRLDVLAEAVRRLGPGHALLALGEGPCAPTGDAVHCLPNDLSAAERARLMASCDAYAHAGGDAEHDGLAVLEAMACGLPVVVSRAGVLGEMAQGAGTTVSGHRVEDWAEALHAAIVSPSWVHFWAALERARGHDWGLVVRQQALRYRQAIGGARDVREVSIARVPGVLGQRALSH